MADKHSAAPSDRHVPIGLEASMTEVGRDLVDAMVTVLAEVPGSPRGPQALATTLGLDKVLTSRMLKATRSRDPMAALHSAPGPEPIRRLLRAARKKGVRSDAVEAAMSAVDRFEALIRDDLGDRAALDAIIAAWLPEARREFELRAKQSAFKAMSHIKGAMVELNLGAVVLAPSDDGERIDVLWLIGLLGLRRLRPEAVVKFSTRRITEGDSPRTPMTLEGKPAEDLTAARVEAFCEADAAPLDVRRVGDVMHYMLGGDDFGPRSGRDVVCVEVNRRELPRFVPAGSGRLSYVFSEVGTPAKSLVLDVLVHESLFTRARPELLIYDTSLEGVASVNDRSRDADRVDMVESLQPMGRGASGLRVRTMPRYTDLLSRMLNATGLDEQAFGVHRCEIDYPVYGSQIAVALTPDEQ